MTIKEKQKLMAENSKRWQEKKIQQENYVWYTVFNSSGIVNKLKKYYNQLKKEKGK